MRADWERQGRVYYYDKYCFDQCWAKIWKWIKVQPVTDVLMRYNLINITNIHRVSGEHLGAKEMADNLLLEIIPKAGCYGYYLLYIAIRDSISSNPIGHSQAIQELKKYGKQALICVSIICMCVAVELSVTSASCCFTARHRRPPWPQSHGSEVIDVLSQRTGHGERREEGKGEGERREVRRREAERREARREEGEGREVWRKEGEKRDARRAEGERKEVRRGEGEWREAMRGEGEWREARRGEGEQRVARRGEEERREVRRGEGERREGVNEGRDDKTHRHRAGEERRKDKERKDRGTEAGERDNSGPKDQGIPHQKPARSELVTGRGPLIKF